APRTKAIHAAAEARGRPGPSRAPLALVPQRVLQARGAPGERAAPGAFRAARPASRPAAWPARCWPARATRPERGALAPVPADARARAWAAQVSGAVAGRPS